MTGAPSRRDFLRGLFRSRGEAPPPLVARLDVSAKPSDVCPAPVRFGRGKPLPVLRPPGAIDEASFLIACTRCAKCLEACPHDAITEAPVRLRGAAGTPMLDPLRSPCRMCPDMPCITACKPRALRADVPLTMGHAVIQPTLCLAWRNSPCSACVEQCPVPGAMRQEDGRPVIDADRCTGCGVCQYVCPAPQNAVIVLPLRERPAAAVLPPSPLYPGERNL